MLYCKRSLAALASLLSIVALLISLGVGVGVWFVAETATAKVNRVFARIEAALDRADDGLTLVRTSLDRAAERLESARQEQKQLSDQPQPRSTVRKALARSIQSQLAPTIEAAHEKLHAVVEAAISVNTVLEDFGIFPSLSEAGLDLDRLRDLNNRIAKVGPAAWELGRHLDEPTNIVDIQFTRLNQALQSILEQLHDYVPNVQGVRQRTKELKERTLGWITTVWF